MVRAFERHDKVQGRYSRFWGLEWPCRSQIWFLYGTSTTVLMGGTALHSCDWNVYECTVRKNRVEWRRFWQWARRILLRTCAPRMSYVEPSCVCCISKGTGWWEFVAFCTLWCCDAVMLWCCCLLIQRVQRHACCSLYTCVADRYRSPTLRDLIACARFQRCGEHNWIDNERSMCARVCLRQIVLWYVRQRRGGSRSKLHKGGVEKVARLMRYSLLGHSRKT